MLSTGFPRASRQLLFRITANNQTISLISSTTSSRNSEQQRPEGRDQLKVFKDNASKWWDGKEFSILRQMNEIRVPYVVNGIGKPMIESKILDVGCGGGILSEPLARLGANVLGIDPVFESINRAQLHSQSDPEIKDRIKYRNCNIEELTSDQAHVEAYDALIASEVVEHIEDIENFLIQCSKAIKPNGSLFITTINQTPLSWLGVIFFGEYVLKQIPKGTHTYDMFVSVKGLRVMLERLGFHIKSINGFMYEPIQGKFYWTPTTLTHYALQAVKTKPLAKGINYEQRRHMAKAPILKKIKRPKIVLDDEDMAAVIPIDEYRASAEAVIIDFKNHLERNLTTRASTSSIEKLEIKIDGSDESYELRDIAQISMKGSNLIVINLSIMPAAVKPTMKALIDLGHHNAQTEVNNIFVSIPKVTREHREHLVSLSKQAANDAKSKLRSLYSQYTSLANGNMEKGISADLRHNTVENLLFDTNKRLQEIEEILNAKIGQLLAQMGKSK